VAFARSLDSLPKRRGPRILNLSDRKSLGTIGWKGSALYFFRKMKASTKKRGGVGEWAACFFSDRKKALKLKKQGAGAAGILLGYPPSAAGGRCI